MKRRTFVQAAGAGIAAAAASQVLGPAAPLLAEPGRAGAFDLVAVAPPYDTAGATTCLLAANLVYEFIALLALGRQANS